jgi:cyclase
VVGYGFELKKELSIEERSRMKPQKPLWFVLLLFFVVLSVKGPSLSAGTGRSAYVEATRARFGTIAAAPLPADSVFSKERQVTKLAEGVYTIRHEDPFPGWVHGNTTVIIGTKEVFVVDSCQLSAAAREDIAQIRQWTDKPVRYLLNTHWHMDHTGGNKDYLDAFPSLAIVAHTETRKMMDATSMSLPALMLKDATATQVQLQKNIESGKSPDGKPLTERDKAETARKLALIGAIVDQAKGLAYRGPTLTFDRELNVDLGNREVQIKHLGRGNTAGDALVYLPKGKILIAGDLLDHPVPYAFDGYPSEWIQTLERMAQLDAETIVPGHGEVLHDKTFLYQVIDLMKSVVAQVNEQLNRNDEATLDEVKKSLDVKSFRQAIAGDDKANAGFFDNSIGSSFVELAYHEAKQR